MENSVVIAGGEVGIRELNGNGKNNTIQKGGGKLSTSMCLQTLLLGSCGNKIKKKSIYWQKKRGIFTDCLYKFANLSESLPPILCPS